MLYTNPIQNALNTASLLQWTDLWPAGCFPSQQRWTEQLAPGVHVLVDDSGEDAAHWLPLIAGHIAPGSGRVQCAGLCTQANTQAYAAHVFWFNPRVPHHDREMTVERWVQEMARRWPNWSDSEWQAHQQGFDLTTHLGKPMWHLSTGTLRKLGLALALASRARLTIISEPIAGLDGDSIRYLSKVLDDLVECYAASHLPERWILVAHWEPLENVNWDGVLAFPSIAQAQLAQQGLVLPDAQPAPSLTLQRSLWAEEDEGAA